MNHQEVKHKKELAKYELVVAIWQWWASAPFPSTARRLGPVKTVISQMKLMWTSGGGFTYSSSRLSSLWLLVHFETLPCLCKTVLFLQPPKAVHQWLNTPKWPYQLFYYFSQGEGGGRQGGRKTFSVRRLSENPTRPFGGLMLGDYAKPSETSLTLEKVNKGSFDHAAEVTFISRSFFIYIYSSCVLYHSRLVSTTYTEWIITVC